MLMKRKIAVLLLLFFIFAGCGTQKQVEVTQIGQELAPETATRYVGLINGKLPIHMKLEVKDGKVWGSYYYDSTKTDITLKGSINGDFVDIIEYDANNKTVARFIGKFVFPGRIEGVWGIENEGQEGAPWTTWQTIYPFDAEVDKGQATSGADKVDAAIREKWEGIWRVSPAFSFGGGRIQIYYPTKQSFYFQVFGQAGGSTGGLRGIALLTDDGAAVFRDGQGGEMQMTLQDGRLLIKANDGMKKYGGHNVSFSGSYKQGEVEHFTLQSLGILPDGMMEEKFKSMTGTHYNDFIKSFYARVADEDIDGYGAKVFSGWVSGMANSYTCIVMWLPDGQMWAALLDYKDKQNVIYYFTNTTDGKTNTPKTISTWIDKIQKNRQTKVDVINYQ